MSLQRPRLQIALRALWVATVFFPVAARAERSNIVLFLVDDLGATDGSTLGSGYYETPNLTRLASGGVRFTRFYAACTVCSPTRASIMTGMTPARLHLTDWITGHGDAGKPLAEPGWTKYLRQDTLTVAEALQTRGYRTGYVGKWHLGRSGRAEADPLLAGFDVNVGGTHRGSPNRSTGSYFADATGSFGLPGLGPGSSAPGAYLTDRLTESAREFIRDAATRDAPFFLVLAHYGVHTPLQAPPELVDKYRAKPSSGGHSNATYAAMVETVDSSLGDILTSLEDPDGDGQSDDSLAASTAVFFTSDNGGLVGPTSNRPLRAGKGTNYEGGVRVPLVVRWPGRLAPPAGAVLDTPAISYDLFPTFLEIAGAGDVIAERGLEGRIDGHSLVPVLTAGASRDGPIYFHYPHYHTAGGTPHSAIIDGDWKLLLDYEDNSVELYDLASDVGERRDLAAVEVARAAALRNRLESYLAGVDAQQPHRSPVPALPEAGGDDIIGINLGTGPNTTMRPEEFAGIFEEDHWNNAISPGRQAGAGIVNDLVDGDGKATGASFSFEAGYMFWNSNGGNADYRMMEGWAGNKASDVGNAYSIRGLPRRFTDAGYDVFIYYDSDFDGERARRMQFSLGEATVFARELTTDFRGVFVIADTGGATSFADARPGNVVVFRNRHEEDFDITADAEGGVRGTVNGLQIVAARPPEFLRGDCNDDETVDISDALSTLLALFLDAGLPPCEDACDANDDGSVDITDAITTLGVLFLGEGGIPAPGMIQCGIDPTDDGVPCKDSLSCS